MITIFWDNLSKKFLGFSFKNLKGTIHKKPENSEGLYSNYIFSGPENLDNCSSKYESCTFLLSFKVN